MNPSIHRAAAAAALLLAAAPAAYAVELASYTFQDESLASADSDPNSAASEFGATGGNFDISFSGSFSDSANRSLFESSFGISPGANNYWTFTVSAESGSALDLERLSFAMNGGGSGTGQVDYTVRSSLDGFAGDIDVASSTGNAPSGLNNGGWPKSDIDLSGAEFQGLATITFQIHPSKPNNDQQFARLDTVILEGDTGAPVAAIAITDITVIPPDEVRLTFDSQAGIRYGISASGSLTGFTGIGTVDAVGTETIFIRSGVLLLGREFFRVAEVGPVPAPLGSGN